MDGLIAGFGVAMSWENILAVVIGCFLGMLVGVLPGLGPVTTISLLLPFTFNFEPTTAIILLAGVYAGVMYGGTITSVLLKLPGEAASVVTAIDGHEMARRGRAGPALGISAIGSFIGASVALVGLTLCAPQLADLALRLGPPEYALLALLGLLLIAYMGNGSFGKAVLAAGIGLFIAVIGLDPVSGHARFDAGSEQLVDGIDIVAAVLGLFGIGEVLYQLRHPDGDTGAVTSKVGRVMPTRQDFRDSAAPIARGSLIGTLIGLLPGGGGVVSSLVSYGTERRLAKRPEEFGKGAIQGVAGPETANNASSTSAFIPLLTLGIPFNVAISLMFSVLLINGITPGPRLIEDEPDLFWGVIASMYLGNIVLLILSLPLVGLFIQILRVDPQIMAPFIILLSLVGVYTIDNNTWNMWVAIIFGVIGYLMRIWGLPTGPLVLAFIIGGMLETSMRQSLLLSDNGFLIFVQRPGALVLLALCVLLVISAITGARPKRRAKVAPLSLQPRQKAKR
ncbi:tripartite tricarboxylate transporter permease [Arthrobacter sp. NPDC057009]|uniref:tripartite tricarboxylate transporter permease n=1 Tax=Arthrobacter sp. NPDC057009 TaxID=3345996 RepID=UPI003638B687